MKKPVAPSNLWEQMDVLRESVITAPTPENAFTVSDYAARYGVSLSTAKVHLNRMVATNKLVRLSRSVGSKPGYFAPKETH
jgi:Fic family protein